jgi:hypothetical protein
MKEESMINEMSEDECIAYYTAQGHENPYGMCRTTQYN